jgi:hypothetical protein
MEGIKIVNALEKKSKQLGVQNHKIPVFDKYILISVVQMKNFISILVSVPKTRNFKLFIEKLCAAFDLKRCNIFIR